MGGVEGGKTMVGLLNKIKKLTQEKCEKQYLTSGIWRLSSYSRMPISQSSIKASLELSSLPVPGK